MLTLTIGGETPVSVAVDPYAAQLPQSVAIQAMSPTATVFISFTKQLAASKSMLPIGVTTDTATVWGEDASVQSPVTAMTGTVALDQFDLTSSGRFSIRIVDAEKPADTFQPSIRIDGSLSGSWDSVQ